MGLSYQGQETLVFRRAGFIFNFFCFKPASRIIHHKQANRFIPKHTPLEASATELTGQESVRKALRDETSETSG